MEGEGGCGGWPQVLRVIATGVCVGGVSPAWHPHVTHVTRTRACASLPSTQTLACSQAAQRASSRHGGGQDLAAAAAAALDGAVPLTPTPGAHAPSAAGGLPLTPLTPPTPGRTSLLGHTPHGAHGAGGHPSGHSPAHPLAAALTSWAAAGGEDVVGLLVGVFGARDAFLSEYRWVGGPGAKWKFEVTCRQGRVCVWGGME